MEIVVYCDKRFLIYKGVLMYRPIYLYSLDAPLHFGMKCSSPLVRYIPYASILITWDTLNNRLIPCDFPNSFLSTASCFSSSSGSSLYFSFSANLCSFTRLFQGSSQNRLIRPLAEAADRATAGAIVRGIGAVNARAMGVNPCIAKNPGNTLFCSSENWSLCKNLKAMGDAI